MFKGIISILLLIIAVAVFFMFIKPLYAEIKELKSQKTSFEETLSGTKQIQEKRDQLLLQYNAISKENLDKLGSIFPPQPGSMKFILEMQNIAQKNGLTLKKIDVREALDAPEKVVGAETKKWETVLFSAKLGGSYKSFYLFLKDIEKNIRLTDINATAFSSGETDLYEFNLEGSFYWKNAVLTTGGDDVLGVLSLLNTINLDLGFFDSQLFSGLRDFSVQLPSLESGKSNPFAP